MPNSRFSLLVIDDDPSQLKLIELYAESIDSPTIQLFTASTAEEGVLTARDRSIDLVLSDYRLPDALGIDVLRQIKEYNPLINVVVMTAFENIRDAVEILKQGGDDYLVKPIKRDDIEHLILRINEQNCVRRENRTIEDQIELSFQGLPFIYTSEKIQAILNIVSRSAGSDARVLITGESGTGKELLARLIHYSSRRRGKPFVTVNIAALAEGLIESELFGHCRGAFTGASTERIGRFEEADGGTLFIDEVGDIPVAVQVKLLRFIQFGEFQRLGENRTRNCNVRIIAASNRNIEEMIEAKSFRSDLYWRLKVIEMHLPPLRERKKDIPLLIDFFIRKFSEENNKTIEGASRELLDRLITYPFPGNIRELENLIERAVIMARGKLIQCSDLPLLSHQDEEAKAEGCQGSYDEKMGSFETDLLSTALEKHQGNQSKAAEDLQISERRLRSRMDILGIKNNWKRGRSPD